MRILAPLALLTFALTAPTTAQTLYGTDGTAATYDETTGPPVPPCLYPNGPVVAVDPYVLAGPCPSIGNFAPPPGSLVGDVAVDRVGDRVFVTDGADIGVYDAPTNTLLNTMNVLSILGLPLTSLGYDAATDTLWMSEGTTIYGATPSPAGSCLSPTITTSFVPTFPFGKITDVSWSPGTSELYACDDLGNVAGMTTTGALTVGPWSPPPGCLTAPFTGVAVDSSGGCAGLVPAIYVTDGFDVSYEFVGGFPAAPTFYTPLSCFPWATGPTQGLSYSARPITYGVGTGPTIGAIGHSVVPNPNFAITLSGATPGGDAYLIFGTGAACPPLSFNGQPWYVLPFTSFLGPFTVPAAGNFTLPLPLPTPNVLPCGISVYMQWMVRKVSGNWEASEGLEWTTSLP